MERLIGRITQIMKEVFDRTQIPVFSNLPCVTTFLDHPCLDAIQLLQILYADDIYHDQNKQANKIEQFNIVITDQYPLPINMEGLKAASYSVSIDF